MNGATDRDLNLLRAGMRVFSALIADDFCLLSLCGISLSGSGNTCRLKLQNFGSSRHGVFCTQKAKILRVKFENFAHFIYRVCGCSVFFWFVLVFFLKRSIVKKLRGELRKQIVESGYCWTQFSSLI